MIFLIKGNQELFHACIQQLSEEQKEALSNALSNGWPSTNISCYPRLQNFIVVCGKTWRVCVIQLGWYASLLTLLKTRAFIKNIQDSILQTNSVQLLWMLCMCENEREMGRERKRRGREKPMNTVWAWANQRSDFLLPMECKLTKLEISTDFKTLF